MSQENVEIVRRIYDAAARRDSATIFSLYDPEVELDNSRLQVVGLSPIGAETNYRGHDGLRRFFREWHDAWENIDYDFDELVDAGGDYVVSLVTRRGRGRASGAEVELPLALLWTLRDTKAARVEWFPSRNEALEAVGRRE